MIIFLILGLILGAVAVIFALQNITTITVTFLAWQFEGSLALIIVLAVLTGIIISIVVSLPDAIRQRFHISNLKRHNNKLQDELAYKKTEVEYEKSKVVANNAYLDDIEKNVRKN